MNTEQRAVCVVSGGLDSVTLGYEVARQYKHSTWLTFDYGQRHRREVECAARCARQIGADWQLVDVSAIGRLMTGNALTGAVAVPHGHYEDDTMRLTVVPNRNAIMLAIAFGVASTLGADMVATAVHSGDHAIYPDCRPAFVEAFASMQARSLEGLHAPALHAPYVGLRKHEIVARGASLQVPFALTWSCYEGGDAHCGRCGTCVERREAFTMAGVVDPTVYAEA